MKYCKYFFIVYAIAILSSVRANAATTVTGLATPEYVNGALKALKVTTAEGTGNVVTDVTQENGKIKVSKGTKLGSLATQSKVTDTYIDNGTISQAKINGLTDALSGKQATLTSANVKGDGTTGNVVTGVSALNGVVTVSKGSITSANNAEITIKQNGTKKGSFTLNQSGAATIELTDNNTTYGIATSENAGLVKSGGDITVDSTTGAVTVNHATKAEKDESGNVITSTYLNKNADTVKTAGDVTETSMNSTDKYPSMAAARQIAASVSSEALMNLVTDEADSVTDGVVKAITRDAEGDFIVEKGLVAAGDIDENAVKVGNIENGAVTAEKTSGVIGQIPWGSEGSTTYAQIWVQ
ncbi:MAG: hypothetical protein ACI4NZ_00740 [Candidatus Enterousia sp.]